MRQPGLDAIKESVWDYPRPPKLVASSRKLRIVFGGVTIAESSRCYRILETSHPPTWYVPPSDICAEYLIQVPGSSFCEFKGLASYWDVRVQGKVSARAAWSYPTPTPDYAAIQNYLAFYPSRVGQCFLDGEHVEAQAGDFYGGWITSEIVGPFKGGPGTLGW